MSFPGGGGGGRGGGGGGGGGGGAAAASAGSAENSTAARAGARVRRNPNRAMDWKLEPLVPIVNKQQACTSRPAASGHPRRDRLGGTQGMNIVIRTSPATAVRWRRC